MVLSIPVLRMQVISTETDPIQVNQTFTIVIPAFNEEKFIGTTLEKVCGFISEKKLSWSVIVSVDGSDGTEEIVSSYSKSFSFVSLVKSNVRSGKGAAVKRVIGMLDSDYVILMDADGSLAIETIATNLYLLEDFDCLVFSRYFIDNNIPLVRKLLSKGFNILVKVFLNVRIRDTQSGYKVFKKEQFVEGMKKVGPTNTFWDVSLFYHMNEDNVKIKEIKCDYNHRKESKFHPLGEIFGQGVSLIAFRVRHSRFFKYIPKELVSLYYRKLRWI